MSFIEQAITQALAQGYKPGLEHIPEAADFSPLQIAVAMKSDVFLEPAFWLALGRAQRWTTDEDGKYWKGTLAEWKANYWKTHWHNFIDHLASGKDAESFFETVLKVKPAN
jgi:hypothetical protein